MAASFEEMGSSASYVSYLRQIAASVSVSVASCDSALGGGGGGDDECRDEAAAFWLKMMAIAAILVSSSAGVAIPLVGWNRRGGGGGSSSGGVFVLVKAFAAGVILATGFVHMLHAAEHALSSPCLPATPWRSFPFPGSVAMLAALGTLIVDLVGTHFYERRHREEAAARPAIAQEEAALLEDGARDGEAVHDGHGHGHAHGHGHGHEEGPSARHVVVSQILELGIVSHSVIIGLSLGVSQSPCTIRPLVVALSFHQFFEGFALGGCIAEAQLRNFSAFMMAFFFAITTPAGIGVGTAVASFYNPNSPRALVVEGILDSMSAGILIYMALVDLIAADFLSRDMSCNPRLQVVSCIALFLGSMAMAAVAIWA